MSMIYSSPHDQGVQQQVHNHRDNNYAISKLQVSPKKQQYYLHHMSKFYGSCPLFEIMRVVSNIFQFIEVREPRFVSSMLFDEDGRLDCISMKEQNIFEVILFLNQMGVFYFTDDNMTPGCGVLKLCDGRKRCMSLWVEFITASGYLSAKKIRARFHSLFTETISQSDFCDRININSQNTEVRFELDNQYTIEIIPAFRCADMWPNTARQWIPIPNSFGVSDVITLKELRQKGFILMSKELPAGTPSKGCADGDAWLISFNDIEARILDQLGRLRCISLLETIMSSLNPSQENRKGPINLNIMRTIVLYESDKHCDHCYWQESKMIERVNSCMLQLVACLNSGQCLHYFIPGVNLFKSYDKDELINTAKQVWSNLRSLAFNSPLGTNLF
ncbi:hypothetical protein GJ496_004280 [Pomphorhynchus laevis]|nr:hypothetical protein GJ496_004280 [Pomphorhynchus laevis]